MGQLGAPWVTPYGHTSCPACGSVLNDPELHERWHEENTPGTRWDKGRDDRFREEEEDGTRRTEHLPDDSGVLLPELPEHGRDLCRDSGLGGDLV